MAEEQKQQNSNEKPLGESNLHHVHGRIFNTKNPEFEDLPARDDISHVDQQEGNMQHGEKGPDLDTGKSGK